MPTSTILLIILVGLLALALSVFYYRIKAKSSGKNTILFAFFRFFTLFFIGLLLINPKFKSTETQLEKPNLVVIADNSSSIPFIDRDTLLKNTFSKLKADNDLLEKFDIGSYTFGKTINQANEVLFTDNRSDLETALASVKEIYRNQPSAVVVLSDGIQTYGNDYQYTKMGDNQHIFPLVVGDTLTKEDIRVDRVNVNKYAYHKNRFPVEVFVSYNGTSLISKEVIISKGRSTAAKQKVELSSQNSSAIVTFELPANSIGVSTYSAYIQTLEDEKNTRNNRKAFAVEVIDQKTKVLIVSDIKHPDIGALKKSIESSEQREVWLSDTSLRNIDLNDFNLVVLFQPNNRFKTVFEKADALKKNKLVIAGPKTDWRFLNRTQTNYQQQPTSQKEEVQPVLNINYNAFITDTDFSTYPPLQTTFGQLNFKVPHQVLLSQRIGSVDTENSLFATFEIDGRKEGVLSGEGLWKWRSQDFQNTGDFKQFDGFMAKVIQYLASSKKKNRLTVNYESFYYGNDDVTIEAQYFNESYEFDPRVGLSLAITDTISKQQRTIPFVLKNRTFEVDLSALPSSTYNFTVKVDGKNISRSGRFKILEFDVEKQFFTANGKKLGQLAESTEGSVFYEDQIDDMINQLKQDERFKTIQKSKEKVIPLINWKYLLFFIILSLSIEWFLRKYNGLI
ncbi:VWA domain-containing protein [Spongiivirga citrea]|uniref:VWA domain-containing protein n=1 Tax=Spongiivirga citrea TaxID=1481457 RepID=A0A6M0CCS3_9FLAO|nr:VWA domain-containing protein [Spongiivirga citrea]NER15596.1 VWA domain-containing protein [Spongiivirga citrea]